MKTLTATSKLANRRFEEGENLKAITFCVIGNIHNMGDSDSHISASLIVKKNSKKYKDLIKTDNYKVFAEYVSYYYA